MALKKIQDLNNGMSGEYVRISEIWYKNGTGACSVKVQLWKDADTRSCGTKQPISETIYDVEVSGSGDFTSLCYNGLKSLSDFEGSEDI
jgi:hypothetical protein